MLGESITTPLKGKRMLFPGHACIDTRCKLLLSSHHMKGQGMTYHTVGDR